MTNVSEIYDVFLSKISDYTFLNPNITEQEINEELLSYLKSATTRFRKCRNDLTITLGLSGEYTFSSTLTDFEIEILATLMIVEYMKPKILSSEILKQSLSDKDFKIYSQASQLRELNLTYRMFKQETTKMITEYTYIGFESKFNDL